MLPLKSQRAIQIGEVTGNYHFEPRRGRDRLLISDEVGERTMIRFAGYFRALTLGFLVMKVLGLSSSASAQTPKVEISRGYQALHALNDTLPVGWIP